MSVQLLKQLKIKTSTLIRLRKQYISYDKQIQQIETKINHMTQDLDKKPQDHQNIELTIKKNKQFLEQSKQVLSNVKQKLIQAFQNLAIFLKEKCQDLQGTDQKNKSQELILEVQTFLEGLTE